MRALIVEYVSMAPSLSEFVIVKHARTTSGWNDQGSYCRNEFHCICEEIGFLHPTV
jgi:hypothetical protein